MKIKGFLSRNGERKTLSVLILQIAADQWHSKCHLTTWKLFEHYRVFFFHFKTRCFEETTAFDPNKGCFLSGGCDRAYSSSAVENEGQGQPFMHLHLPDRLKNPL